MSQADLAQKIGVHPETVANWEHSRTIPDVCRLQRIIEFLGYNPLEVTQKAY
jgi:transcriptional regulator with XRE-family HTH domain